MLKGKVIKNCKPLWKSQNVLFIFSSFFISNKQKGKLMRRKGYVWKKVLYLKKGAKAAETVP